MKLRSLITATFLAFSATSAVYALEVQTYGQDVELWQQLRDKAWQDRGPAGLVEFDRENALRFYGNTRFRSTRDLDAQISIDRKEAGDDTQLRADQIRYGFGRSHDFRYPGRDSDTRFPAPVRAWELPRLRQGDQLPREYFNQRYFVEDWRAHRLPQPRRGQQWVQIGPDYMLVNRNGVIQSMERPR